MSGIPERQIRGLYDDHTIRVYQAYRDDIADSALSAGTFLSPPFSLSRMTWIKPSFLWMMYRAGWGYKDEGQRRILAIDITHEGFRWALEHSCPSHADPAMTREEWARLKEASPVRIQWDPERDLQLQPQPHRAVQIGLTGPAVQLYVSEWIRKVTEVTDLAHAIHSLVATGELDQAERCCRARSLTSRRPSPADHRTTTSTPAVRRRPIMQVRNFPVGHRPLNSLTKFSIHLSRSYRPRARNAISASSEGKSDAHGVEWSDIASGTCASPVLVGRERTGATERFALPSAKEATQDRL